MDTPFNSLELESVFKLSTGTVNEILLTYVFFLIQVSPVCHLSDEDIMAEVDDRVNFVDMLKKMLQLDVAKRITPSQLLEDPFITMSDIAARYPYSL